MRLRSIIPLFVVSVPSVFNCPWRHALSISGAVAADFPVARFSHGEVVAVSELRDFQDTDLSNLQEGSSCLARHEDGIWYPAKITGLSFPPFLYILIYTTGILKYYLMSYLDKNPFSYSRRFFFPLKFWMT